MQQKSEQKSSSSPLGKWHDELMRHLTKLIEKNRKTTSTIAQLVELVFIDQTRAPWPGSLLTPQKRATFRQWLEKNARLLAYSRTETAVEEFAAKVSSRLLRELSASQISWTLNDRESEQKAQLEHMIRQEMRGTHGGDDPVGRSVQRYLKATQHSKQYQSEIKVEENNPVRDLLGLPRIGRSLLPREDIRVHLARFLTKGKIPIELLAASMEPETLLGEFSKQCTFVGFADIGHRIILLEVKSGMVAQELNFQKLKLLKQIRKTPEMAKVLDVRFNVKGR
jgi:hypothetical protein